VQVVPRVTELAAVECAFEHGEGLG
jgi:hypothetical protein